MRVGKKSDFQEIHKRSTSTLTISVENKNRRLFTFVRKLGFYYNEMHKTHNHLTALGGEVLRTIWLKLVKKTWKILVGIQYDVRGEKHVFC
jgi:hypothetical protein